MPFYAYRAKNAEGRVVRGRVEADNRKEALDWVREQGLWTLDLDAADDTEYIGLGRWLREVLLQPILPGLSAGAKAVFFRQMATMVRAGVGIPEALRQLAANTRSGRLRRIALDVSQRTSEGEALSKCLASWGSAFRRDELELVRAGELSGTMDEALANLASYLEEEVRLQRETALAACYPVAVGGCALVLIGVIVNASLLVAVFRGEGNVLQLLWGIFGNLVGVITAVVAVYVVLRLALTNRQFRYFYDTIKLNLPIIGGLVRRYAMARFGRVFGALYRAGVPAAQNLEAAAACVPNYVVAVRMSEAAATVKEGEPVSEALARTRQVPDMVLAMLRTGEKTGDIDETLHSMAEYYESDVRSATRLLLVVLFVLLVVGVGAGIGYFVIRFWVGYFSSLFDVLGE